MLWHLPLGLQAVVCNVSEAYHIVPLHFSQWPRAIVCLSNLDSFAINTNSAFGMGLTLGVYGNLKDAGVDIIHTVGLGPLDKWVGDHIFMRIL